MSFSASFCVLFSGFGANNLFLFCNTVRCGDCWCKIDGVYACAFLKISNSPFCVIPFHCLFVLLFVSFFLDSKQIIFFSFVI